MLAVQPLVVTIPRGPLRLAGHLYLPGGSNQKGGVSPGIVVCTPGSSVRGQVGANYGSRLAKFGVVALVFDPAHQGESTGEPRDLEDPYARTEDIRFAVDFLTGLDYVDEERIGVLGVCAGGGYAVHAAMTEHRIKAVGTVVPVNIGRAFRQADTSSVGAVVAALETLGRQRAIEARGGESIRVPWLPDTLEQAEAAGISDIDVLEAVRFYRTPRGHSEHSTNRRLARSDALLLGFDAFHLASELLTQPLQVIVGGRLGTTGSYADGLQLWEMAPNATSLIVIDGAGHYELYDDAQYVDPAVQQLGTFFAEHL